MKSAHNLDAKQLIKVLQKFGYKFSRQSGSHIRLTTQQNGQHHITIPNHDPLKIGTLNAILSEVAQHSGITKQEVFEKLF